MSSYVGLASIRMLAKPFALLAAALFLGGAAAGCIGKKGDGAAVKPGTLAANNSILPNETSTPNGEQISAFKETNATETGKGGMQHTHDYWKGRSRVPIMNFDGGLLPIPLTPHGAPPGTAIADFNVPAPNLVFEGTSQVEVLFTDVSVAPAPVPVTPHPNLHIHVWYITAADEPGAWHDAGNAKPDVPLVIPVKPRECDMPHSVASLWLFRIFTDEANEFWFNVTATAVRGSAVAIWPPHPDLYAKGPQRTIFDGPAETDVQPATDYLLYGEDSNWFYPEKVISYGTDKVVVDVTDLKYESQISALTPAYFYLDYHNASFAPKVGNGGTSGGSAKDPANDGKKFHFEIPTNAFSYDTPYGVKSRWAFRMLASFQDPPALGDFANAIFCVNCAPYKLTYHLKIVAVGHSTAAEGIDMMDFNANATAAGSGKSASAGAWEAPQLAGAPDVPLAVPARL